MHELATYKALLFDCDGVVLNSNKVKTEAFYKAAEGYGEHAARSLVEYHKERGGVSRYVKFQWFVDVFGDDQADIDSQKQRLLEKYASFVKEGLRTCEVAPGLSEMRQETADATWFLVSGGDQEELRELFQERGLDQYFDGGIFGSPRVKEAIITAEVLESADMHPALFLGDSLYDYEAAEKCGLDFVFLYGWTELQGWSRLAEKYNWEARRSVSSLLRDGEARQGAL